MRKEKIDCLLRLLCDMIKDVDDECVSSCWHRGVGVGETFTIKIFGGAVDEDDE